MNENKELRNVPKYKIFEKEITDKVIIDDLIAGDALTQVSFSYKTETLIQFMYYCLNYFFKNKTYGENMFNIELHNNSRYDQNNSYLFIFKMLLPNIFKLIIKYLSINNKWFNFMFNGFELINLIRFLDTKKYRSFDYNSLLHYLLSIKYKLIDNRLNNNEIMYSNWPNILLDEISNISSEIIYFYTNSELFNNSKEKIFKILGFNGNKNNDKISCKICKLFPSNLIYFKCGHYFCYYCYFYNSKSMNSQNILNEEKCFFCKNKIIPIV